MYWTELMRNILKSEMGRKIIREVAPVYEDAYVALWLFEVIGEALSDVEFWTDEFKKQVVPQTATWSLPMWESRYGINIDKSLSDEQRQRQIVLKRSSGHSPMNVRRLEKIISLAADGECKVEEYTGSNRFTVHILDKRGYVDFDKVWRTVDEAKQAHLIYDVAVQAPLESYTVGIKGVYSGAYSRFSLPVLEPDRSASDTVNIYGASAIRSSGALAEIQPNRAVKANIDIGIAHTAEYSKAEIERLEE